MKVDLTVDEMRLVAHVLENFKYNYQSTKDRAEVICKKMAPRRKVSKPIPTKRYSFNFASGGWNTVWAKTKAGAYRQAVKEYGEPRFVVIKDSIRVCNSDSYDRLIRMSS